MFLSPAEPGLYVVKRIMGIPGDRIHLRDGAVYRNGEKLDEPYVIHSGERCYNPYRDNFPAVAPADFNNVTPDGRCASSSTFRATIWWCLPTVISAWATTAMSATGQPLLGIHPKGKCDWAGPCSSTGRSRHLPANIWKPEISQRVEFVVHRVIHFFDQTRWRRTLQVVR